jgi:Secretion system C-terminal sorting domain
VVLQDHTNGILDNTFGIAGYVIHPVGTSFDEAYAIALQNDGKILLGGFGALSTNDMAIMRLHNVITIGIQDINNENSAWITYPVPVIGNELYFENIKSQNEIKSITILDLTGRVVATYTGLNGDSPIKIQLPSELNVGVYVAKIDSFKNVAFAKFIKQ